MTCQRPMAGACTCGGKRSGTVAGITYKFAEFSSETNRILAVTLKMVDNEGMEHTGQNVTDIYFGLTVIFCTVYYR